ncbi:MAG: DUF1887 family CARF protein [Nitrospirota bacterium]
MSQIHVCLVSGQPIPNLIPLKIKGLSPEKVVLLVSPDMKVQAERIEGVIKSWGIDVERYPIAPFDLESARDTCLDILSKIEDEEVILNVTGGTKIMALAAFEVFREMKKPILYVDTQNREIQEIYHASEKLPFESVLKIKPYLASYGQKIINEDTDEQRVKRHSFVISRFISDMNKYERSIGIMNKYAAPLRNVRTVPVEVEIDKYDLSSAYFDELLILLQKENILKYANNKIKFSHYQDINFVSGGWLEEYVYSIVNRISPDDIKMGVKVEWDQKGPEPPTNEYDVIFTMKNRLYIIECKTKRFEGDDRELTGSDPIYKLDSLRDAAGGLFGKGMLVSYRKLTTDQKKRLKANKLEYCDGSNLRNLDQKTREWLK